MKSLEQKVIKFINREKLILPGEKILIALSGGPDSVFALTFFNKYKKLYKTDLVAFHLNHCLRNLNADDDEEFCRNMCKDLKIDFFSEKKDVKVFAVKNKISVEEGARIVRYKELEKYANLIHADKIVTAHNKSDNSETILLNLLKGSGSKGLAGIPFQRGKIIRPLLILSSEEIREYLKKRKINYRVDETNLQNDYQRNFIRNEIIPLLKKVINPSLDNALFRSSYILKETNRFVDSYVNELWNNVVVTDNNKVEISVSRIDIDRKNLLGLLFQKCFEDHLKISYSHTDFLKMYDLIGSKPGTIIDLTENYQAIRERKSIIIYQNSPIEAEVQLILKPGEKVYFNGVEIGIEEVNKFVKQTEPDGKTEYFSLDATDASFVVRYWRKGDNFVPLGRKSKKNISEFLIDRKVSSFKKKEQLIVENRNNIVWVVGLRLDNRYKITNETKRVGKLWMK